MVDDIEFRRGIVRVRRPNRDLRLLMSLAGESTHVPGVIIVSLVVDNSDEMTETTVFLDTDKVVDLAIVERHRGDSASHDEVELWVKYE